MIAKVLFCILILVALVNIAVMGSGLVALLRRSWRNYGRTDKFAIIAAIIMLTLFGVELSAILAKVMASS